MLDTSHQTPAGSSGDEGVFMMRTTGRLVTVAAVAALGLGGIAGTAVASDNGGNREKERVTASSEKERVAGSEKERVAGSEKERTLAGKEKERVIQGEKERVLKEKE